MAHHGSLFALPIPAGNRSLVIEATLSTDVLNKAKKDKKYKQWLIQWALEKVEEKLGVDLSRSKYLSFPCVRLYYETQQPVPR